MKEENALFDAEGMQSPFDAIREVDAEGREWWNSCRLAQIDALFYMNNYEKSEEATKFRIWAREVLKQYIIKGFVMDDERLKGKNPFDADYFEDLLERTSEIRRSERTNCQKITDIYAEFSYDYDSKSEITKTFYMTMHDMMQNDKDLNLLTTAFIDIAERRARRHVPTTMAEWNEKFRRIQDKTLLSDFDKFIEGLDK